MADDIDRANDYVEQLQQIALEDHFRKQRTVYSVQGKVFDSTGPRSLVPGPCVDCGLPIHAARLRAKPDAGRCLPCQIEFEAGQRRRI